MEGFELDVRLACHVWRGRYGCSRRDGV
jgi:hypothetical protein